MYKYSVPEYLKFVDKRFKIFNIGSNFNSKRRKI